MRGLVHFAVHNPVVANLAALVIVAAGLIFGLNIRREFFPEVRPNKVIVAAPYPGASPEEIERSLAIKIEDAIDTLTDVKEIVTTISEGLCSVTVEFKEGVTIADAVSQVKRKMDALQDLPQESERIVVSEFEPNLPVISLNLIGEADERTMKEAIRAVRDDLRTLTGMGDLSVSGIRRDEVRVAVDPAALLKHGIGITEVADRIARAMREIPGGTVRTSTQNIAIRAVAIEQRVEDIRRIAVKTAADGSRVLVEDVADVELDFVDVDVRTRLNGRPAVSVTAFKVGDQDAIEIADMIKAYAAGRKGEPINLTLKERIQRILAPPSRRPSPTANDDAAGLGSINNRLAAYELGRTRGSPPPGELTLTTDLSRFISGRLELLGRNALWGGILVLLTLVVFLNYRVAMWVTAGLVVAVLGTLAFMWILGITLNLLTMFGLIIVIGLLVDDAIVVAENIVSKHESGEPALAAAVNGTRMVAWPVVVTVLTTIFAFGSLTLIDGQMGDLLGVLPQVVLVALAASLFESIFILPSHMAHSLRAAELRKPGPIVAMLDRFDAWRSDLLMHRIVPRYVWLLRKSLRFRYITVAAVFAVWIVSIGMIAGGRLEFTFLGSQDAETLVADLRMPIGTPASETDRILREIERAVLAQEAEVISAFAQVGARSNTDGAESSSSSNVGQVWIELKPSELRKPVLNGVIDPRGKPRSSDEVIQSIRDELEGKLAGVRSFRIQALQGGPEGPPLSYTITGDNPARIQQTADEVARLMSEFAGVYDVSNDADAGQRELRIELLPGASELGFTVESLARQIRGWVFGLEAYTFARPDEDVDVRVVMNEPTRRSLGAIERLHVFTPDGRPVPLIEVASISEGESFATIRRLDRRRAITVSAEVRDSENPEQISAELAQSLAQLDRENPHIFIEARGRQKDVNDSLSTLPLGILAACGLIYVCLAWLFGSYIQPLLVLCAVPLAMIGMVWGHIAMGFSLTLLSLIGFLALTGVVVNDSLIFVEFYNHKRKEGLDVPEAAAEAGRARFRAILLTTLTTVLGLSPLMMETDFQAKFLIPMAITISFGLISATVIILLALPCFLVIGRDIKAAAAWLWRGGPNPNTSIHQDPFAR